MSFRDKYSETISISEDDITLAQRIIIEGFMREGEFTARESLATTLEQDVTNYLAEAGDSPNLDWIDGVRYAIHIIKEADFEQPKE